MNKQLKIRCDICWQTYPKQIIQTGFFDHDFGRGKALLSAVVNILDLVLRLLMLMQ